MEVRQPGQKLWDKIVKDNKFLEAKEDYELRLQSLVYTEEYR